MGAAPGTGATRGGSCAPRASSQHSSGRKAITAKQMRKASRSAGARPAWSISIPARKGPTKFAAAGAMASQLNTRLSCVGSVAERPTCRCSAMTVAPVAPPVSSAAMHMTGNTGKTSASPAPPDAAITDSHSGRLSP
ncbi:hypothetical protein D9M69_636940 [compost metagenome]